MKDNAKERGNRPRNLPAGHITGRWPANGSIDAYKSHSLLIINSIAYNNYVGHIYKCMVSINRNDLVRD